MMKQVALCCAVLAAVCIYSTHGVGEAANTCTTDAQCTANITGSICHKAYGSACDHGVCVCHSDEVMFNDTCITGVALGAACEMVGWYSNCADYVPCLNDVCACQDGASYTAGTGCVMQYSGYGNACNVTADCDATNGQMCNGTSSVCDCTSDTKWMNGACMARTIGDMCWMDSDCQTGVMYATCVNNTCACGAGLTYDTDVFDMWSMMEPITSAGCWNTSIVTENAGSGSNCEFSTVKYMAGETFDYCSNAYTCMVCPTDSFDMSNGYVYNGVCTSFTRVAVPSKNGGGGGSGGNGSGVISLHPVAMLVLIIAALLR